jgi:hypothetical protein
VSEVRGKRTACPHGRPHGHVVSTEDISEETWHELGVMWRSGDRLQPVGQRTRHRRRRGNSTAPEHLNRNEAAHSDGAHVRPHRRRFQPSRRPLSDKQRRRHRSRLRPSRRRSQAGASHAHGRAPTVEPTSAPQTAPTAPRDARPRRARTTHLGPGRDAAWEATPGLAARGGQLSEGKDDRGFMSDCCAQVARERCARRPVC